MSEVIDHVDHIFDLFGPQYEDNSIARYHTFPIPERNNEPSSNGGIPTPNGRWYFDMKDTGVYHLPSRSYIYLRYAISTTDNNAAAFVTAGPAPILAALQNNFPFFTGVQYFVNGQEVVNTPLYADKVQLISNLLEFSYDNTQSSDLDSGFFIDTAYGGADPAPYLNSGTYTVPTALPGAAATFNLANNFSYINPNYNWGYAKRLFYDGRTVPLTNAAGVAVAPVPAVPWGAAVNKTNAPYNSAGPNVFTVRIPLWRLIRFFSNYDKVFTGVTHELQLQLNPNLNQLFHTSAAIAAGAQAPQLRILQAYWMMPIVRPSTTVSAELNVALASGRAITIPYEKCEVVLNSIPVLNNSINYMIRTQTERPTKVVIVFQDPAALANATYNINGQIFTSLVGTTANTNYIVQAGGTAQITNMFLTYGGKSFPEFPYRPAIDGMIVPYQTYLHVTERLFDLEGGPAISFDAFQKVYPLYIFDLRYLETDGMSTSQTSDMILNVQFTGTIAANTSINIFSFIYSEAEMNIQSMSGKVIMTKK